MVMTEGMVGEVAEGTEETGTALPHLVTDVPAGVVAVTIMTVGTNVVVTEVTIVVDMTAMTVSHTMIAMTDTIALMTSTIAMNGPDPAHILPEHKNTRRKVPSPPPSSLLGPLLSILQEIWRHILRPVSWGCP